MIVRALLLLIVALLVGEGFSLLGRQDVALSYNPRDFSTGIFAGCPPEGLGGDSELNILKNRDKPPDSYRFKPIGDLCRLRFELANGMKARHRSHWSNEARAEIIKIESQGIVTEGYLIACAQQGVEACNCFDPTRRDYHLWLGPTERSTKGESMIAEISPRTLKLRPAWDLKVLKRLAKQQALIRVSGWAMWDGEHGSLNGKTRSTLLEIHPIHRIEVRNGTGWVEL